MLFVINLENHYHISQQLFSKEVESQIMRHLLLIWFTFLTSQLEAWTMFTSKIFIAKLLISSFLKVTYFRNVFLGSSISSKKRPKTSLIVVKLNSFVRFFEDIPKNHFEINWPLVVKTYSFIHFLGVFEDTKSPL